MNSPLAWTPQLFSPSLSHQSSTSFLPSYSSSSFLSSIPSISKTYSSPYPNLTHRQFPPRINPQASTYTTASSTSSSSSSSSSTTLVSPDEQPLQIQVLDDFANDTIAFRSLDFKRSRFDIEFALTEGTTYNSYLIQSGDATALIETSHKKFESHYFDRLRDSLHTHQINQIDYLIVNHTEPDHAGLVAQLIQLCPNVTVVGTKVAITFLKEISRVQFKERMVKSGDELVVGQHTLQFISAPNLHWPDTMLTYDTSTNVLYTCDVFGAHYCTPDPYDLDLSALLPHYRFYYDCLMHPNARSLVSALKRIQDIPYHTIATGHGPIHTVHVSQLVDYYTQWSSTIAAQQTHVAMFYSAAYGFADRLAQSCARGISKAGVRVEMCDLDSSDAEQVKEVLTAASGVVLVAPKADALPSTKAALSTLLGSLKQGLYFGLVESFGGDDEPVDILANTLRDAGLQQVFEPLRIRSLPTEATYQGAEEAGTDMAQEILKAVNIKNRKNALPPGPERALGRISGGLYIVTAQIGDSRSACLASWVAQASFQPLGLTVAIAKDRAIESFMQVGHQFVINVLAQGTEKPIMKHFLKRFPAGADRFDGIDHKLSPRQIAPVLSDALAYIELEVVSRMELSDHWCIYAKAIAGDVKDETRLPAPHFRKVGTYY